MSIRLRVIQSLISLLSKTGRGGSLPGALALKMDKNFLSRFTLPKEVIVVSGTNGKTTTSNLIAESLRNNGLKVANNHRGDNLNVGIATLFAASSNNHYEICADALVVEVDELTLYRQFENLKPSIIVVTNFFRDQLDRAGEMETIILKFIEKFKTFRGTLVLNGDDPNVVRLKDHAPLATVRFFSVNETMKSRNISDEASEGKFCPRCGKPLQYDYYQYSHIGRFACHYDQFGVIQPYVKVEHVDFEQGTFMVDDKTYHSFINAIYAIYNCASVLAVLKTMHLDLSKANDVFSHYQLKEGRNEVFHLSSPCIINLVKNPTGANEVMKFILSKPEKKNLCIFLNDNDQDGHDVSWIWDAHFERLNDTRIQTILCSGKRAYDMALRLKYEGLENKIRVEEDARKAIAWLDEQKMNSYIIATYTALHSTRALLRKQEKRHQR